MKRDCGIILKNSLSNLKNRLNKYFLNGHKSSLKSEFTLVLLVVFPCMMIITGIYFYTVLSSILTKDIYKDLSQLVQETNSKIESPFTMADYASFFIASNPVIKENLINETPSELPYIHSLRKVNIEAQLGYSLYYNYAWESSLFKSIYIFKSENTYYYLNRYFEIDSYKNNLSVFKNFSDMEANMNIFGSSTENQAVYLTRKIVDPNTKKSYGTIVLSIDEKVLEQSYTNILGYLDAQIYIYDNNGTILSCKDKEMLGKNMNMELRSLGDTSTLQTINQDGKQYYYTTYKLDKFGIKSLILIPKKNILFNFRKSINFYIYVIIVAILLSAVLGVALTTRFMRPINDIVVNINKFKGGDFSVKMPTYKEYELNELSIVFNKMTGDIQNLFQEIYEKQLLLKESELKLLQSQINPHFLFNVLDVISWEARISHNDRIYEMITSLGQLVIANITLTDKEKITVREEREYIKFYTFLQKMRFGEKLIININISDDEVGDFYIPKFCVYSIVENAIVHGLEKKMGERKLDLTSTIENNTLFFEVIDNGVGFSTDNIDLNSAKKMKNEDNKHTNIGLYNANKRIKLLYGNEFGITIFSKINDGTKVIVKLPIDRGDINV